ncbi:hypothetical protein FOA52_004330 [Chlamydomonas sp. UWO 241]|nr:hypothetical protein FOA52_004330 [Chlamydomonas sp. UWO 241]
MRLLVNCPSGESRLLQVDSNATVAELKHELHQLEGIPVVQQVLCYAGNDLKDHLTLADHELDQYTLSDEVVIYLSKRREKPKLIYLASRARLAQKVPELVEADMPVGDVAALLDSRGLAGGFAPGAPIYCKRQDGSTVPLKVDPKISINALEERIAKQEGIAVEALTFMQAQDGAMHVFLWPSSESSNDVYPVYARSVLPQPAMPKKDVGSGCGPAMPKWDVGSGCGVPFEDLGNELCMLP